MIFSSVVFCFFHIKIVLIPSMHHKRRGGERRTSISNGFLLQTINNKLVTLSKIKKNVKQFVYLQFCNEIAIKLSLYIKDNLELS